MPKGAKSLRARNHRQRANHKRRQARNSKRRDAERRDAERRDAERRDAERRDAERRKSERRQRDGELSPNDFADRRYRCRAVRGRRSCGVAVARGVACHPEWPRLGPAAGPCTVVFPRSSRAPQAPPRVSPGLLCHSCWSPAGSRAGMAGRNSLSHNSADHMPSRRRLNACHTVVEAAAAARSPESVDVESGIQYWYTR